MEDYRKGSSWASNKTSPEILFEKAVLKRYDIIEEVVVDLEDPFNGVKQVVVNAQDHICGEGPEVWLDELPYYYNGDCYSLNLPRCLSHLGILEIMIKLKVPADIFVHHGGQLLSPNSRYAYRDDKVYG